MKNTRPVLPRHPRGKGNGRATGIEEVVAAATGYTVAMIATRDGFVVSLVLGLLILPGCKGEVGRKLDRADDLYKEGEFAQALVLYRQVLELEPGNADAHYSIGVIHYSRDDYPRALVSFGSAIESQPDRSQYHLLHGHTLARLGRYGEAVGEYETVLVLDPSNEKAVYSIGISQYNLGNTKQAIHWLTRYIAIAPDAVDRESVEGLIRLMRESGA